ncbi:MAG: hypothetical protein QF745_06650, partial [Planctomycetota bacterium]|nr:hypothetical protein [Planctomycetota bacterium]
NGINSIRFGSDDEGADGSDVETINVGSLSVLSPAQNNGEYKIRVILDDGRGAVSAESYTVSGGATAGASSGGGGGGGGGCGGVIGLHADPFRNLGDLPWFLLLFFWIKRSRRPAVPS